MLSKLIRYEWKAVARVCIPMYGGLILAAMLTHFLLGNLERFSSTLYDIITMAMSTLCFGLFMAAFVLTLIIQIQRFSKNLLGDEGYLMFTLPASVSQRIHCQAGCGGAAGRAFCGGRHPGGAGPGPGRHHVARPAR